MNPSEVPTGRVDEIPEGAVLLDVREHVEWAAGHIAGAVHIPMNEVPKRIAADAGPITPEAEVVVLCKVGGRSAQVTAWLAHHGYKVRNLEGGMLAWEAAGRPMEADGAATPEVL